MCHFEGMRAARSPCLRRAMGFQGASWVGEDMAEVVERSEKEDGGGSTVGIHLDLKYFHLAC